MSKKQLLQEIVSTKGFLTIKPLVTTYGIYPIVIDPRILISHPKIFIGLTKELAKLIKKLSLDFVAGIETAGIPLATALALETNLPLLYVRKERRNKGKRRFVEGNSHFSLKSQRAKRKVALIDDLIDAGQTKKFFIRNLETENLKATDIAVWFSWNVPYYQKKRAWLRKSNIKLHWVFSKEELFEAACRYNIVPKKLQSLILNFAYRPETWLGKKAEAKYSLYQTKIKSSTS